jgi:hypothetical protein
MHKTEMITLLQDNKITGYEIADAETISNFVRTAGHTVNRFNQRLKVFAK